jgi:hypothetical protein
MQPQPGLVQQYPFISQSQSRACFSGASACLREGLRPGWNCNEAWPNVLGPDIGQRQRVDYQDAKGGWHHTSCGAPLPPHLQNIIGYPRQLDELAEGRALTPRAAQAALQAPLSPRSFNRPLPPRPASPRAASPRLGDAHGANYAYPLQAGQMIGRPMSPRFYLGDAGSPRSSAARLAQRSAYASFPLH